MIGLNVNKNGSWVSVELPEDLELTYVYNNPTILFGEIITDRTTEIQIPATPKNNTNLGFINALEGVQDISFIQSKLTAQLVIDGVAVEGNLFIVSANAEYYSAIFGLMDKDKFSPLLKNLNEIYTGTDAERIEADRAIKNVGLDIIAMRYYDTGVNRMASYADRSSYLPSTNIYTLIKTLLQTLNIAFDETGITDDEKLFAIKLGQINGTRRGVTSQVTLRQDAGGTVTITQPMPAYYQAAPNIDLIALLINYNSKYTITVTRWPTPNNPYVVRLIIVKQVFAFNFGSIHVGIKNVNFTEVATQGDMSEKEVELTEGDLLCFAAIQDKVSGDDEEQILYFSMADQAVFTIKNTSEKDLIYGDDYYLKDNLPDISLYSLLQTWGVLMNKTLQMKEIKSGTTVTPTISYKDLTVIRNYTKAIDVAEENDYSKNYQVGNWAQNNYITFADDDDAHTHAINFPSQNNLLELENVLFEIPFAQGETKNNSLIYIKDADIEGFTSSSGAWVDGVYTGGRRFEWKETDDYITKQTTAGLTPVKDISLNDLAGGILAALTQLSINVKIPFYEFYNLINYDILVFKGARWAIEEAEYADGGAALSLLQIGEYTPPTPPVPPVPTPPTISITASSSSASVGNAVSFNSSVNPSGGSYQWYRDGAAIVGATGQTFVDTQNSAGSHSYYCTYTTTGGTATSNSISVTWNVVPLPTISITASSTTPWAGSRVNFTTNVNPAGGSYQWYRDNVLLTGETNSTYSDVWEAAGAHTYYCEYTTGAGTTQSNTVTVTWQTTTITISADYTLLPVGASVNLTATVGTSGGSYQWFRDGTAISGATSSTYRDTPTSAQTYNYTCTYTVGTASVSSNSVQVEWRVLAISISADATSVQTGTTVTLTASITGGLTGGRYVWYKNGTAISGSNTYQITDVSSSATTNTYYCTYMLNGVTVTSNSVSVTWTAPVPTAQATLYFDVTIYNDYSYQITCEGVMDNGIGGTISMQQWVPALGTAGVSNSGATFAYQNTTSYVITLRVTLTASGSSPLIQNYNFSYLQLIGQTTGTNYGNYRLSVTGGGAGSQYVELQANVGTTTATEDVRFEIVGSIETQH